MPVGRLSVSLVGADVLAKQLASMAERLDRAFASALYDEANELRAASMANTPVDKGVLRASHYATLPAPDGGRIVSEVGAGGPAEPYAMAVHERMDVAHEVGGAKFLEAAVDARTSGLAERISEKTRRAFERLDGPLPPLPRALGPERPDNATATAMASRAAARAAKAKAKAGTHRRRGRKRGRR